MIERTYKLKFSWVDPKGRIKFPLLLELFQEIADEDAAQFHISTPELLKSNLTWVVRKYSINFTEYPSVANCGTFSICTFAAPQKNLFSVRTHQFFDGAHNLIGTSVTWWVLADYKRMRPMRLDKCEVMKPLLAAEENSADEYVKLPPVVNPFMDEIWRVRWLDLDLNNHTNNVVYFRWVLDTVPREVPENYAPVMVEGEFFKAVPRVSVRCLTEYAQEDLSYIHSVRNADDGTIYAAFTSKWK